jgi:hypothetical protein
MGGGMGMVDKDKYLVCGGDSNNSSIIRSNDIVKAKAIDTITILSTSAFRAELVPMNNLLVVLVHPKRILHLISHRLLQKINRQHHVDINIVAPSSRSGYRATSK